MSFIKEIFNYCNNVLINYKIKIKILNKKGIRLQKNKKIKQNKLVNIIQKYNRNSIKFNKKMNNNKKFQKINKKLFSKKTKKFIN